jgi:type II secretory pathway pseudopilin PulG
MLQSQQKSFAVGVKKPRVYMRGSARAFTLTELLIVIGIIVLFITLALPAFNLISGSKSIAGAENILNAMLGRAHSEAIGVQDYRGLAIYRDAATDRYSGAIVLPVVPNFGTYATWSGTSAYQQYSYIQYTTPANVTHYYVSLVYISPPSSGTNPTPDVSPGQWSECGPNAVDIESDTDVQTFPAGVGVQLINNWPLSNATPAARQSNGYLPVGVIFFDGNGVLKLVPSLSIAEYGHLGTLANLKVYNQGSIPYFLPAATPGQPSAGFPLSSSMGLVAFDKQSFEGQNFYSGLPSQLKSTLVPSTSNPYNNTGYTGSQEPAADSWLDNNATPLLINRYNGTLVRSE